MNDLKPLPFLHWPGGKRQLLPEIKKYMPIQYNVYYEPFIGAGALLFELQPKIAIVNDFNDELINCYKTIKDNLDDIIKYLQPFQDTKKYYYSIRELDRNPNLDMASSAFQAARMLYLNRTCFNGLYRVNSKGYFNTPYGYHNERENFHRPLNYNFNNLKSVNQYLQNNSISFLNIDFSQAIQNANKNDFVYLDPPYDAMSNTANFTAYTAQGFDRDDQTRLFYTFKKLSDRGCYCMLSNAGTDFIKNLYKEFNIQEIKANRVINCKGDKRGKVSEVLIMNY